MRHRLEIAALLVASLTTLSTEANGQQFKVYTRVTRPTPDAEIVARSMTYFHAGRVYDWIPTVGEVTVFEPAHERFVVFAGRQRLATRVSFDEIERLLASARNETRTYADRLLERNEPGVRDIVEPIRFQLAPRFTTSFDNRNRSLNLLSPRFRYRVECREPQLPEAQQTYLDYTDWAARLNYVLHPRTLYPAPRLKLNEQLRQHNWIPSRVELRVDFDKPLELTAEHQFGWSLDSRDRQRLHQWREQLVGNGLEWRN